MWPKHGRLNRRFYRRFPKKASFLDFTVGHRLSHASERTAKALEVHRWRRASNAKVVAGIVEHLVVAMHGDMRGAVRTAFRRRGPGRDEHCPLRNYQTVVADASVALLLDRLSAPPMAPVASEVARTVQRRPTAPLATVPANHPKMTPDRHPKHQT